MGVTIQALSKVDQAEEKNMHVIFSQTRAKC